MKWFYIFIAAVLVSAETTIVSTDTTIQCGELMVTCRRDSIKSSGGSPWSGGYRIVYTDSLGRELRQTKVGWSSKSNTRNSTTTQVVLDSNGTATHQITTRGGSAPGVSTYGRDTLTATAWNEMGMITKGKQKSVYGNSQSQTDTEKENRFYITYDSTGKRPQMNYLYDMTSFYPDTFYTVGKREVACLVDSFQNDSTVDYGISYTDSLGHTLYKETHSYKAPTTTILTESISLSSNGREVSEIFQSEQKITGSTSKTNNTYIIGNEWNDQGMITKGSKISTASGSAKSDTVVIAIEYDETGLITQNIIEDPDNNTSIVWKKGSARTDVRIVQMGQWLNVQNAPSGAVVSIFTMSGQRVYQQELTGSGTVSTENISQGCYIVKVADVSYKFLR